MKVLKKRTLSRTSKLLLLLGALIVLTIFLSGCARTISSCPPYPVAGPAVGAEIKKVCNPVSDCPRLFEWLDRIGKLKDQLDLCKS